MNNLLDLIGRIFISSIFLFSGINKILNYDGTTQWMEGYGIPGIFLVPAIIIEIIFPLFIIIGYKTKIAALVMALFTLTVAIIFHTNFNNGMQMTFFLKDLAIAGGFIIILINGAGLLSIDHIQKSKTK